MTQPRRFIWTHLTSGTIPVMGEGLASSVVPLTLADEEWLNTLFYDLKFTLQEWDGHKWLPVFDTDPQIR